MAGRIGQAILRHVKFNPKPRSKMKLIASLFALIGLTLLPALFAQEESPAASPAEETGSATVETSPAATPEMPAATSTPMEHPSPAEARKTQAPMKAAAPSGKMAAAPSGKKMSVEASLKEMENKWAAAYLKHDAATVEPMVAEDFVGVNPKGKVENRHALLAEVKSNKETYTYEANERMQVHRYGNNVAVVVGTAREKGMTKDGKRFDRTYRYTDTWMERGGKWQCVAEQVTLVSAK
jgi:ketosteroid isomerase-like protein